MFGLLKESIVDNLSENYYQDKKLFQKNAKSMLSAVRKSKTFNQYLSVYKMVTEANFNDFDSARLFIDESINHLKTFNSTELIALSSKVQMNEKYTSRKYELIDKLLDENTSLNDRIKYKTELVKSLVNQPDTKTKSGNQISIDPNYEATFKRILNKKLTERISSLNEDEKKVLSALIKEDKTRIDKVYGELITENLDIIKTIDGDAKAMVESKLNQMKSETVTTDALINLIELKNSLKNV